MAAASAIQTRDNAIGLLQGFIRKVSSAAVWGSGVKAEAAGGYATEISVTPGGTSGARHGPGLAVQSAVPLTTPADPASVEAPEAVSGPMTLDKLVAQAGLHLRELLRRQCDTTRQLLELNTASIPEGKPLVRRNPEPSRRRTHWDALHEEAAWAATDVHQTRRWKVVAARGLAHEAAHAVRQGRLPWVLRSRRLEEARRRLQERSATVGRAVAASSSAQLELAAFHATRAPFSLSGLTAREQLVAVRAVQLELAALAALAVQPVLRLAAPTDGALDACLKAPIMELVRLLRGEVGQAKHPEALGALTTFVAGGPSPILDAPSLTRARASAAVAVRCANVIWTHVQRAALAFFATYGRAVPSSVGLDVSGVLAFRPPQSWGLQEPDASGQSGARSLLTRPAAMAGFSRCVSSAATVWLQLALRLVGSPLSASCNGVLSASGGLRASQYALARGILACWITGAPALVDGDAARAGIGRTTSLAVVLAARNASLMAASQARGADVGSDASVASLIVCDGSSLAPWVTAILNWAPGHELLVMTQPPPAPVAAACVTSPQGSRSEKPPPLPRVCIVTSDCLLALSPTFVLSPSGFDASAAAQAVPRSVGPSRTWSTVIADLRRSDLQALGSPDTEQDTLPCRILARLAETMCPVQPSGGDSGASPARCVVLPSGGTQLDFGSLSLAASPVSGVRLASLAYDTSADVTAPVLAADGKLPAPPASDAADVAVAASEQVKEHRVKALRAFQRGTAFRLALAGVFFPVPRSAAVLWAVAAEASVAAVSALALPSIFRRTDGNDPTPMAAVATETAMSDVASSSQAVFGSSMRRWLALARDSGVDSEHLQTAEANPLPPIASLAAFRVLGRALSLFAVPLPMPSTGAVDSDEEASWRPAHMERKVSVPVTRQQTRAAAVSVQSYASALQQSASLRAAPPPTDEGRLTQATKHARIDGVDSVAATAISAQSSLALSPAAPAAAPPERIKPGRSTSVAAPMLRRWLGLPVSDSAPYTAYALRMGIAHRLPEADAAGIVASANWRTSLLALHLASQHGRLGDPAFLAELLSSAAAAVVSPLPGAMQDADPPTSQPPSLVDHGCLLDAGPASFLPLPLLLGCGLYNERQRPSIVMSVAFAPPNPVVNLRSSSSPSVRDIENALASQICAMELDSSGCARALLRTSNAARGSRTGLVRQSRALVDSADHDFCVRWEPVLAVVSLTPWPTGAVSLPARMLNAVTSSAARSPGVRRSDAARRVDSVPRDFLPPLCFGTSSPVRNTTLSWGSGWRASALPLAIPGRLSVVKVHRGASAHRQRSFVLLRRTDMPRCGWFAGLGAALISGSSLASAFSVSLAGDGRVRFGLNRVAAIGVVQFALLAATAPVVALLPQGPIHARCGVKQLLYVLPRGAPLALPLWEADGVRISPGPAAADADDSSAALTMLPQLRRPCGADVGYLCRQSGKLMAARALLQEATALGRSILLVAHCPALVDATQALVAALRIPAVRLDEPGVPSAPATVYSYWSSGQVARFNALVATRGRVAGIAGVGVSRALASAVISATPVGDLARPSQSDRAAAMAAGVLGSDVSALAVRTVVVMDTPLLPWSPVLSAVERRLIARLALQRASQERTEVSLAEIASARAAAGGDQADSADASARRAAQTAGPGTPSAGLLSVLRLTSAAPSLEAALIWAAATPPKASVLATKLRLEAETAYSALSPLPNLKSPLEDALSGLLRERVADVAASLHASTVAAVCLTLLPVALNKTAAALALATQYSGAGSSPDSVAALRSFALDHTGSSKAADALAARAQSHALREGGAPATVSGAALLRSVYSVSYADGMQAPEGSLACASRGVSVPASTPASVALACAGWGLGTLLRGRVAARGASHAADPLDYKRLVPEVLAFTDVVGAHQDAGGLHFSHAYGPPHPEVKLVRAPPSLTVEPAVASAARVSTAYLENSLTADQNRFPAPLPPPQPRMRALANPTLLPAELRATASDALAPARWAAPSSESSFAAAAAADGTPVSGYTGGSSSQLAAAGDGGRGVLQQLQLQQQQPHGSPQLMLQRSFSGPFGAAGSSGPASAALVLALRVAASAASAAASSSRTGHMAAEAHTALLQLQKSVAAGSLWQSLPGLGDGGGSQPPLAAASGPAWPGGEDAASAAVFFSHEADTSAFPAELVAHLPGCAAAALAAVTEATFAPAAPLGPAAPPASAAAAAPRKDAPHAAANAAVLAALSRGYGTDRSGRPLTPAVVLPLSVISGEAVHAAVRACPHALLRQWMAVRPPAAPQAASGGAAAVAAAAPAVVVNAANLSSAPAGVEAAAVAASLAAAPPPGTTPLAGSTDVAQAAAAAAGATPAPLDASASLAAPPLPPPLAPAPAAQSPMVARAGLAPQVAATTLAGRKRRHGEGDGAEASADAGAAPLEPATSALGSLALVSRAALLLQHTLPAPAPGVHHWYSAHLHDGALAPVGLTNASRRARQLLPDPATLARMKREAWQPSWTRPAWPGAAGGTPPHASRARSDKLARLLLGQSRPAFAGVSLNVSSLQLRGVARSQPLSAYLLPSNSYVLPLRAPVVRPAGEVPQALPVPLGAVTPAAAVAALAPPAARPLPSPFAQHGGAAAAQAWGGGGAWDGGEWSAAEDLLLLRAIWEFGSNWDVVRDALQGLAPIPGTLPGALGALPPGCFVLPPRSRPHRTARHCYDRVRRLVSRQVHFAAVLPSSLARSLTRGAAAVAGPSASMYSEPPGAAGVGVAVPLYALGSNAPPRRGRANPALGFAAGQYSQTAAAEWRGGGIEESAAARVRATGAVATRDLSQYATLAHAPARPSEVRHAASVIADCMRIRPHHHLPRVISDDPTLPLQPAHVSQMGSVADAHAQVHLAIATYKRSATEAAARAAVAAAGGSSTAVQTAVAAAAASAAAAEAQRPPLPTGASLLADLAAASAAGYAGAAPALLATGAPTVVGPAVPVSRFVDIAAVMLPEGLSHFAAAYAPRYEPYRKTSPYIVSLRGGRGTGSSGNSALRDPRLQQQQLLQQQHQQQLLQQHQQSRALAMQAQASAQQRSLAAQQQQLQQQQQQQAAAASAAAAAAASLSAAPQAGRPQAADAAQLPGSAGGGDGSAPSAAGTASAEAVPPPPPLLPVDVILQRVMALPSLHEIGMTPAKIREMLLPLLDRPTVAAISAVYGRRDLDAAAQERAVAQIVHERL